jgi:hypothetical protein
MLMCLRLAQRSVDGESSGSYDVGYVVSCSGSARSLRVSPTDKCLDPSEEEIVDFPCRIILDPGSKDQ